MTKNSVSSPASTGGAGTFFEQHVGAYWLAQLLVRSIPPILIDCTVVEVHFQTERLGWHTDDFLIECSSAGTRTRKLAGQVKRSFSVSAADKDCRQAIGDFWKDFNDPDTFCPAHDRLLLITQRGTNTLLEHFVGLLECARAARDPEEFKARLETKGFISETAVRYCGELQKIISELEARSIIATELWPFLRVLHLISLDLHTSTRQTEAQIRSLLAYTVTDGDAIGGAEVSWNALLSLASVTISEARSLCRDGMPESLKRRHNQVATNEQRVLRAAKEHCELILRGIHSNLGQGFHLERTALIQQVLTELEMSQVVLVSGPAGSGKSVIGKEVVRFLSVDHFTFGFRAEEFAQPHMDATLNAAHIVTNGTTFAAFLAAQDRKVVVIESIERLLEKSTRDAFADFMTLVSGDSGIRVVLTCRDYSIDQVRASFLQSSGIGHAVVIVPPLEDGELVQVQTALPMLACPLQSPALRGILRNPYFLDKALDISWSPDRPLPESEREFRALFWRQIVRADQRVPAGTARRREQVFQEIALRRARALSPHVQCGDLDPDIVAALTHDALINSPEDTPSLATPAHDVLEDWAILHWIEEQNLAAEGLFNSLAAAIGTYPAIRRSYRKWLSELVNRDPTAADKLFVSAIASADTSAQFRDDTLVSLLKASSPDFLSRHERALIANDRALLKRVIHLLRVACMTSPTWLPGKASLEITFSVPDGPAWAAVLKLVHGNVRNFEPKDRPLLLGLVEDAVNSVSWWAPDIQGAEQVVGIAHSLVPRFDDYLSEKLLNRVLKVIAKIPKADPERFEALLRGSTQETGKWSDRIADAFQEIIFAGYESLPAARDLPDVVLSVAADYLLCSEQARRERHAFGASIGVERYFGIKEERSYDSFPASAIRGPWIHLFRTHPDNSLAFLVRVLNHSADWYAHPRFADPLEPAWEIELTFADGTTRKQWGNPRLWNLYRGMSVGPDVLQTILMAFESWLLEYSRTYPKQLDVLLVDILRQSETAALAAVVAGVATASPKLSGEALLVLLSARDFIGFDLGRCATEPQMSAMSGMLSGLQPEHNAFEAERKAANELSHRKRSLEDAIRELQLGPLASRTHAVLDRHKAALPPIAEQNEEDRMWRLEMHRMDLRQSRVSEVDASANLGITPEDPAAPLPHLFRLDPTEPEPDVKEMVDRSAVRLRALDAQLRILNWGYGTFKGDDSAPYDPDMWQALLLEVMSPKGDDEDPTLELARGGPGILAAVCIRDHWEEMSDLQREWCIERVCVEAVAAGDRWNGLERVQRNPSSPDRASAWVLSLLPIKSMSEGHRSSVQRALAVAVTHPISEVRWHAVWGIALNLTTTDRALSMRCINALAMEATIIEGVRQAQDRVPYPERREIDSIAADAANTVRNAFWEPGGIPLNAYQKLDVEEWFGADANALILTILSNDPENPAAVPAFAHAAQTLLKWWDEDDCRHRNRTRRERNRDAETGISECLQRFVMRTPYESARLILEPIVAAIDRHPREVHWITQGLTSKEDSNPNTSHYWALWQLFADGVKRARWTSSLDDDHPFGSEMLGAVFLTSWWKDSVRHWRSLEGYAHHIDALFEALPPTWIVLDSYVRFLYHIGERSLPEAFVRVANSLRAGDPPKMLADSNTVFMLVVLLQRHVYGRPLELKRHPTVRNAVLYLLDALVENGSAPAFRMRDDFVTPASA